MKGQAMEYLLTYGWMVLVVAIIGGAIFATIQEDETVRNSTVENTTSQQEPKDLDPMRKRYIELDAERVCWEYNSTTGHIFEGFHKVKRQVCFRPEQVVVDPVKYRHFRMDEDLSVMGEISLTEEAR